MNREPLLKDYDLPESPSSLQFTELSSEKKFENLICPITHQIMKDPHITKYGNSYEKDAILEWLSKNKSDPFTRQPLQAHEIYPNLALKAEITSRLSEYKLDHLLKEQPKSAQTTPHSAPSTTPSPAVFVPYTPPPAPTRERMVERTYRDTHPNCCVENVEQLGKNYIDLISYFIRCQACDERTSDGNECENTFCCLCACLLSGIGSVAGCPVVAPIYCCTMMCEPCCPDRVVLRTETVSERGLGHTA